jgi:ketosteroid isomerase-like protein
MAKRVVKVSEGVGALFGGPVPLRDVLYRLFRSEEDAGTARPGQSFGPVEGQMHIGDVAEAVVLSGVDDLVLQLEDGRLVTITLTSTGGRFEVRSVAPVADGLRDFAERYTAAWCSRDPKRVAAFFAPDGSLTVNDAPPATGRHAITEVAQGFMTAFPDLRVVMHDLVEEGSYTIYPWTLTGTNSGPGGTNRPVRVSGFEKWVLSPAGLIAESVGQYDAADYQRQIDGR